MSKLRFEYKMALTFSAPVRDHYFTLRCIPQDSARQRITLTTCEVVPPAEMETMDDGLGNLKISGCLLSPHDQFGYTVAGIAETVGMIVVPEPLDGMYRYATPLTAADAAVVAFAEEVRARCQAAGEGGTLALGACVMGCLHERLTYLPGVTDIATTAGQALAQGQGVCQDYAHIMTAVMRQLGVPARYVSGLMIGEGASHAWTEIYTDGGWYGFDPTNNLHIDGFYIKLAHGRDYNDCVVNQGRFFGCVEQKQEIYVNVEEISDDRDSGIGGAASR